MKEFLETFTGSYVQLFDDRKYWSIKPPLPRYDKVFALSELVKRSEEIQELNRLGVGVFFTPNPCNGGRKEEDVTAIKWVYVDMDGGSKEEQMKRIKSAPIHPGIIIESLRSYHCYWRCDLIKEQFQELISGLIIHFNGDVAISSTNEVLRVPGFYHNKYPNRPFLIEEICFKPELKTFEELSKAYPQPMKRWQSLYKITEDDTELLKSIPIKQVLDRFGVQYTQKNELIEDGDVTSAIINTKQNYINRFSGKPPSGSNIDIVMYFNQTDVAGACDWLRETFPVETKTTKIVHLIKKQDYKKRYTWGTPRLNDTMPIIKRNRFTVLYGTRGQGKTTYIFDVAVKNAKLGHDVLFLSLEMREEDILDDLCRRHAGITISEEYNYRIPESKQLLYDEKIKEYKNIPTLHFRGWRSEDRRWSTIKTMLISEKNIDMVIIDNLDRIANERGESSLEKQIRVADDILEFTEGYYVPVVLLAHTRKFLKGNSGGMDEMAGSGKVADGGDYVVRVVRDINADIDSASKYETVLHCEKGRGYTETTQSIFFHKGSFYDVLPGGLM